MSEKKVVVDTEDLSKALDELDTLVKGCAGDKKDVTKGDDEKDDKKDDDVTRREDEDADKSFAAAAEESENIKKGLEVSEFLNDLVSLVSTSVDGMRSSVSKGFGRQEEVNTTIAKSMSTIAKSIQSIAAAVTEVAGRMDAVEKQPASLKKSITATAVDRSFTEEGEKSSTLTKSMVCNQLNDAVMKGEQIGGCPVTAHDAIKFEATGQLRPDLKTAIFGAK